MEKYLTDYEIKMFETYAQYYGNRENSVISMREYLEEHWFPQKKYIIENLFKGKTIIEKEITIEKDNGMLIAQFDNLISNYYKLYRYVQGLFDEVYEIKEGEDKWCYPSCWSMFDKYSLSKNAFCEYYHCQKQVVFTNSRTKKVKKFMTNSSKPLKIIQWLLKEADAPSDILEIFEEFRINHSKILQDKTIKQTFCLSVHPMDFATMSDNCNNWESCMSWQENGCYRAGTLEMLNSPHIIVGYLKSDSKNLVFDGYEWNSKIWRCLFYVDDKAIITGIKGYPFQSEELVDCGLKMIADLTNSDNSWTEIYSGVDSEENYGALKYPNDIEIYYTTDQMYNDSCCAEFNHAMFTKNYVKQCLDTDTDEVSLGGTAYCLNCGKEIENHEQLTCDDCSPHRTCINCGCQLPYFDDDDVWYDEHDNVYCSDCWHELADRCEICYDSYMPEDMKEITLVFTHKNKTKKVQARICRCCYGWYSHTSRNYIDYNTGTVNLKNTPSGWIFDVFVESGIITQKEFKVLKPLCQKEN